MHWTTLDDINAAPRSVMQYRSVGETSVKGYISRTRCSRGKFNKDGELEEFVTSVMEHLKNNGLEETFLQ